MKVNTYKEVQPVPELPGVLKRVVIGDAEGAPNYIMRVFDLEPGASTPYHTHNWEHEVYVLAGNGTAVSSNGETPIKKDSAIFVKPNEKHCFKNTGKTGMRMICVIPKV